MRVDLGNFLPKRSPSSHSLLRSDHDMIAVFDSYPHLNFWIATCITMTASLLSIEDRKRLLHFLVRRRLFLPITLNHLLVICPAHQIRSNSLRHSARQTTPIFNVKITRRGIRFWNIARWGVHDASLLSPNSGSVFGVAAQYQRRNVSVGEPVVGTTKVLKVTTRPSSTLSKFPPIETLPEPNEREAFYEKN
jgi:hypothetical protein